eukprot:3187481-Rhodomonas_salina.3
MATECAAGPAESSRNARQRRTVCSPQPLSGHPFEKLTPFQSRSHLICNVCRTPFNVAPPKRIDILSAISEINWDRIKPGLLLVSTESMESSLSPEIPSAWQVVIETRRAYWKSSVYLITAVQGIHEEPGGGDAVQGVNLTRLHSYMVRSLSLSLLTLSLCRSRVQPEVRQAIDLALNPQNRDETRK